MAATALAGTEPPPDPRLVELELGLAQTPAVYLQLNLAERRLEVRSRGAVLDSAFLDDVSVLADQPFAGEKRWPQLEVPALWRVAEAPDASWRAVKEPEKLVPYTEDEKAAPTPTPTPVGEPPAPLVHPTPTPGIAVPATYGMTMDNGWRLEIVSTPPARFLTRLKSAMADGWSRVKGEKRASEPPRLVLTVTPDAARWLHHFFRPQLALLIVSG